MLRHAKMGVHIAEKRGSIHIFSKLLQFPKSGQGAERLARDIRCGKILVENVRNDLLS